MSFVTKPMKGDFMRKSFITLFLATLTISGLTSCNSHTHSYDVENPVWQWTQYSAATVTFTCSDCEDTTEGHTVTENATITEKQTVKATCEEDGYKVFEASATFLEKVYTNSKTQTLPKLGHTEDTSKWKYNETSHWHDCLNCGDAHHFSVEEHTFSDWSVTKEADHYSKGTKERYCTVCNKTENTDIEMTKFTYAEVKALHDKFATFTNIKSYFISHAAEDLAYSIENIDPNEKIGHEDELTKWGSDANESKTYFNENFSVVFDSEAMDTYSKTISTREFYNGYGSVLKVNGDATKLDKQEIWDVGSNRKTTFDEDIEALVFAVYNTQPMNVTLINSNSSEHVVPFYTNGTIGTNKEVTCDANKWTEFHFYVSDVTKLDEFYIGLYLTNGLTYGIPTSDEAATKGSGYITEVVGVKSTYYKSLAASVTTLITGLSEDLDLENITLADGTQINNVKDQYDALPLPAQKYVTNLDTLQKYVDAFTKAYYTELASGVVAKIAALQSLDIENLQLSDGTQIKEARAAYNALEDTVKEYVTNIKVLEDYEAAYAIVYKNAQAERVANIITKINNLPALNLTDGVFPNISYLSVLDEYNELDDEYKATVTNRNKLLEFNDYFECVVSASNINAFSGVGNATTDSYDDTYGNYRQFTCNENISAGCFHWTNIFLSGLNYDDYSSFTFAFYNEKAIDWHFTNWTYKINLTNGELGNGNEPSKTAAGWNVVTISSDNMKTMFTDDSVDIATYFDAEWGLNNGNFTKITNIYGTKNEYTAARAKNIKNKISAISSLDKDNLTLWNGGQILEASSEYDALPEDMKSYVDNYQTLQEYQTAYASKGVAYNYKWQNGAVDASYVTTFDSTNGIDGTYGFYTQLDNMNGTNCSPNISPVSDKTISGTAKMAIYVSQATTLFAYSTGWTRLGGDYSLTTGWNEITFENIPDNNPVKSITILFIYPQNTSYSGIKVTPIYSEVA